MGDSIGNLLSPISLASLSRRDATIDNRWRSTGLVYGHILQFRTRRLMSVMRANTMLRSDHESTLGCL